MEYRTLNPFNEELLERFPTAREEEIERALAAAADAFSVWRREGAERRTSPLLRASRLLEERREDLARLMALEMGKPLAEGRAEVSKCALACTYYAEHGPRWLASDPRESDATESFVRYEPLGPILAIMPWNFPFWQFFRFAAPALTAGNVTLLKHAPCTPRCAGAIEGLLREAGYPAGVVRSLFLDNEQAARVMADDRVRGVTLTGSTRAGSEVAVTAGRYLKPLVLELGGSDPFVVFEDADLDRAVEIGVLSRCLNSGQSCIAAKRFLVQESVHDGFVERFVERMEALAVGDPLEAGVAVGPLARADLRDRLADQVQRTLEAGGILRCGGVRPSEPGFFYPPTVLTDVPPGAVGAEEELFGPVACVFRFADEEQAISLANDTPYGLGAGIWTADRGRAYRVAAEIQAGNVFVNGLVKSDPRLPFGGVKDSGFGRELSHEGLLEFVNPKTVWIA